MIKWWKARSRQEKVMVVIIIMLVIGIILRWGWIKQEAGDAIKGRIERTVSPTVVPGTETQNTETETPDGSPNEDI